MSLLSEAMEACVLYNKVRQPDGYGGFSTVWTEGAEFECATVKESSPEIMVAEAQGVKEIYTVTTSRSVVLEYHDVFKRKKDGAIFRVTSYGTDKATPMSATLDMRQVSAERWELPNE